MTQRKKKMMMVYNYREMKVKDIQVWPSLRMKLLTEGLQARARARAHSKFETFTLLCFYQILSF